MSREMKVGIADMKIMRQEGVLITYALGSCVGISFYDPSIKLAALLHIMLPDARLPLEGQAFKFADTGIRETLRRMSAFGGTKECYVCKIAGGAKMFEMSGTSSISNIGQRNVDSVRAILRAENLPLKGEDVGSNYARTMLLDAHTGQVRIRTFGKIDVVM